MPWTEPVAVDDAEVRLAEAAGPHTLGPPGFAIPPGREELAIATEAFRVTLDRSLAERLLAGLRSAETPAGHLAQKVTHESLGYCGWRQESARCIEHRLLVSELAAALETED